MSDEERLRRVLAQHAERIPPTDLDAVRRAYELISQAGLAIGEEGEDWPLDSHRIDTFDKFDLERLMIRLFFPRPHLLVNEAYGVQYTSELGYPRAFDEEADMHDLLEEWAQRTLGIPLEEVDSAQAE